MRFLRIPRGFIRAFLAPTEPGGPRHSGHSLARTLKDSTHVRGGPGGGLSRAGTEQQHNIVAKGHQGYAKSFKGERDSHLALVAAHERTERYGLH